MTLEQSRRVALILHDCKFTPWMVDCGDDYAVRFIVDGVMYEVNEKK